MARELSINEDEKTHNCMNLANMGSETPLKIPFIDLSNINKNTNSLAWDAIKTQVHQALEEFGCFEANFANIPPKLQTAMSYSLQLLFDFPLETKLKNISLKRFQGYNGQYQTLPLYESMGIEDPTIPQKAENFTKIFWPEGNPEFCKTVQEFSEKLLKLDQMVRMMVLESLGLEKHMDEHMDSTNYLFRVMKYKAPKTDEFKLGCNSHTDSNLLTILQQNDVGGLEVQSKSRNWIKVQPSVPNSFVVMAGDSFHAWTNGRLHPPYHQVMMSGNKARYSLGLFSVPKDGHMIKAPEEAVDEEHPLLFKPYDYSEFLHFYDPADGQSAHDALKTYCGV